MTVAALICARGGSKRIPRKNVAMCAGKKLIEWPLIAANEAKCIDRLFVSTEDAEIAEVSRQHGAEIIDRPWQLATDFAADGSLAYHAYSEIIKRCNADYIIKLHATSPCIEGYHIDEALQLLLKNKIAVRVFTQHKIHKPSQLNNYYFFLPTGAICKVFPENPLGIDPFITNNLVDIYWQNGAFSIERMEKKFFCLAPEIPPDMDAVYANDLYASYFARMDLARVQEARNILLGYTMSQYDGHDINYPDDLIIAEAIIKIREEKKHAGK